MKYRNKLLLNVFVVFLFNCGNSTFRDLSFSSGSDISENGRITSNSTDYTFSYSTDDDKIRDLCNFIYFQGDTLCFSAKLNRIPDKTNSKVYYVVDGKRYQMERTEYYKNRIFGFSLVGSLLEVKFSECMNDNFETLVFPIIVKTQILIVFSDSDGEHEIIKDVPFSVNIK